MEDHEQVTCPICKRPLFVTKEPDGKARFQGCGKDCVPVYWVPQDSIILGPEDGAMLVYRKRWMLDDPPPTLVAKYTNLPW
jgi:hypothetical protein